MSLTGCQHGWRVHTRLCILLGWWPRRVVHGWIGLAVIVGLMDRPWVLVICYITLRSRIVALRPLGWLLLLLLLMLRVRCARVGGRGDGIWLGLSRNIVASIGVRGHMVLRRAVIQIWLGVSRRGGGIEVSGCHGIDSSPLVARAVVLGGRVRGHGIGL